MAVGKSKRTSKGKKGGKKKMADSFVKKEWYNVRAPKQFETQEIGVTPVNKTQGIVLSSDSLKGRVFEFNLADLSAREDELAYRKIKLICSDIRGKELLTDFAGLETTTDAKCMLIRKWHSVIDSSMDVTTVDGFTLRVLASTYTKKAPGQLRSTSYAKSAQKKAIRVIMQTKLREVAKKNDLATTIKKFCEDNVAKDINVAGSKIYPINNTIITKVKVLKRPPFDQARLNALHSAAAESGARTVNKAGLEQEKNILTATAVEN